MPFVPVPKDLTKVKTKVAFNLTRRQLVCFGGGALVGIPTYLFTRGGIGNDMAALLMIGLMLPFFLFGIYEKDGQPLEKVLGHIIRAQFLCPKVRPYQTDNLYAALERLNKPEKEVTHIGKQAAGKAGQASASRKKGASGGKGRPEKRHPADAGRKAGRRGKAPAGRRH